MSQKKWTRSMKSTRHWLGTYRKLISDAGTQISRPLRKDLRKSSRRLVPRFLREPSLR